MYWKVKMSLSSMVFMMFSSLMFLINSVVMIGYNCCFFLDWEIISVNSVSFEMAMIFDWMSMMFLSFVCFISSMVLYYSGGYMSVDFNITRFIYLVLGFVFSMLLLIVSPNLVSILLGWDGLGLVSYALVVYYQNEKSSAAGMLTALSNRVGDVAILFSIAMMSSMGAWNFIFYVDNSLMGSSLIILIILAAMTKSAQIPFSAWLPAAMAAPTPVSALVHSSTLVTAGVYLLIRFSSCISELMSSKLLLLIGCLTMFMAGLGANFETDLKKIIALSTLSQLGVMVSTLALGWANLAFFHLLAHALFKALLFMCAGSLIHSVGDSQDIRTMGGLVAFMPMSVMMMNLSNLSLCGFPFLAGFYSKDLILEVIFLSPLNELIFWLYVISTGLTVCYTFRLIFYSLSRTYGLSVSSSVEDDSSMTTPMLGLAFGAIFSGCLLSWMIFPAPIMICMSQVMKLIPLMVSIIGAFLGYILNLSSSNSNLNSISLYSSVVFLGSIWFLPFISTIGVGKKGLIFGYNIYRAGDSGWSEWYGGQGGHKLLSNFFGYLQISQENNVKVYMLLLMVWMCAGILYI